KAEVGVLSQRIDDLTKRKSGKGKIDKGKSKSHLTGMKNLCPQRMKEPPGLELLWQLLKMSLMWKG
ncbi:hypothetical protein Tco_0506855, partial [Tanacetum coccineum]